MNENLKDSVLHEVEEHRLWLVQKCKIPVKYHAKIAAHLYRLCAFIGMIPPTISHNSPILAVEKNDREYLVDFPVNRFILSVVLDYLLRSKAVNNATVSQFQQSLEGLVRAAWSRIWKTVPTDYHIDHCCANALELMFGGNADFRPFVPSGGLIAGDKYINPSEDKRWAVYREFYSQDLNARFYATEGAISDWGEEMEWRFIVKHQAGFPQLGKGRGRCLPRLAVSMAVSRFVFMELGARSTRECELTSELRQSLMSRDNHKDLGEFPWMAFAQSTYCTNQQRAIDINFAESNIDSIQHRADYCGMNYESYCKAKNRMLQAARKWYEEVGVDLD